MFSRVKNLILIAYNTLLFLIVATSSVSHAQLFNSLPANVSESFAQGILQNSSLTMDQLRVMAKAVFMRAKGVTESDAQSAVNKMDVAQLRQTASKPFLIDYIEIRKSDLMAAGKLSAFQSEIIKGEPSPLFYKVDGVEYVRWFFHPLRDPKDFLRDLPGVKLKIGRFLGQLTESRSVVVLDRTTGDYWSLKLSLPEAVGPFTKKRLFGSEVVEQLLTSDIIAKTGNPFVYEQEGISFQATGKLDEGISVRSIRSLFENGQYAIPFSAIFSRGLKFFLNPILNASEIFSLEKQWLAEAPARFAAALYFLTGLLHNSNHSQNSILVLSADKLPIAYLQRDADFDIDSKHPKYNEIMEKHPFSDVVKNAHVDYSMYNGNRNNFYAGSKYLSIVNSFFNSFINYYSNLAGLPQFSGDSLRYLIETGYYRHKLPVINLDPRQRLVVDQRIKNKRTELERVFPELVNLETDPVETLKGILNRENASAESVVEVSRLLARTYGEPVLTGWNEIISEFLNPLTREKSYVMRMIHMANKERFKNFCVLAGRLYIADHEAFIESVYSEVTKFSNMDKYLELLLSKFTPNPDEKYVETVPPDVIRLHRAYMSWLFRNQKERTNKVASIPIRCEMLF